MKTNLFRLTLLLILVMGYNGYTQSAGFEKTLKKMKGNYTNENVETVEHFLTKNWINKNDKYASYNFLTYKYFKLEDYHFVPVSVGYSGVCSSVHLVSYTKDGEIVDEVLVETGCDRPGDATTDDYLEYHIYYDTILEVRDIHLEPLDKTKLYSSDYDWMSEPEDSTFSIDYYAIRKGRFYPIINGNYNKKHIEEFTTSEILFSELSLKNLTKAELRVKRNEIYARKGYIFKSKDLLTYFETFDWYNPVVQDATEIELNTIEMLNINHIQQYEN